LQITVKIKLEPTKEQADRLKTITAVSTGNIWYVIITDGVLCLRNKKALGFLGEDIAVKLVQEKGFTVLERNFRCKHGEIDIIARDGKKIIFIEVKTRKSARYGTPEEAVDWRKQKKLRLLAVHYLSKHCLKFCSCRFDVYSIYLNKDNDLQSVRIIEDCF